VTLLTSGNRQLLVSCISNPATHYKLLLGLFTVHLLLTVFQPTTFFQMILFFAMDRLHLIVHSSVFGAEIDQQLQWCYMLPCDFTQPYWAFS